MKRFILIISALLLVGAIDVSAKPKQLTPTITWELDKYGTLSLKGYGAMPSPKRHKNTVKEFPWLKKVELIKRVEIGHGITTIGEYAFCKCSSLTSVTIPDSVTSIGGSAFSGCTLLTSITIPNSVTSTGDSAFWWCTLLTSVTIPDSVTSIGDSAFSGCTSLTSVTIGDSVTSIGDDAFSGCTSLTSVTIPNSVTTIGKYAFYRCSSLTCITIPNSVTSIGDYAFYNCTSLPSITIPNSVTSIGDYAFSGCTSLTSITIPNSVTSFGKSIFHLCKGELFVDCNIPITHSLITKVTFGNSVRKIGGHAIYDSDKIKNIIFGDNIQSIDHSAFTIGNGKDNQSGTADDVLYNGEITNLPHFITAANCEKIGISLSAYKRAYPSSHDLATKANEEDDPDKALELYLKGTTAREEEGEKFTRSDCYFGAGLIYSTEKNDNHKAIEMWEKADKLGSNGSEFIKGLIAKAKENIELEELHKKTEEYLSDKDYANAIKCYQRSYEINKSKDTAKQIAELLLKINDYDMALKYYLEVGDWDWDSCCAVPKYFENKKDYQNAIKYYRRVAEMGNNGVERYAVWEIASLQFNYLQDYASAFEGFKLYKTHYEDDKNVYKVPEKYKAMGDYANAIKYYKKIYDEFNEERAAHQLIELYLKTGRYNEAIEFYSPAARNGDKEVQYKLAQVYEKAKNKNMAIFWYKKSAEQKYLAAEEALAKYGVYLDNRPKTTQTTSSANSSSSKSNSHNHNHNDVHINTYQPEYGYRDVWKPCTSCGGSGRCSNCNGTGQKLYGGTHKILSDCPVCHSGRCSICYGQGGHYEKEMYQIR